MTDDIELSNAIIAFLQKGAARWPRSDADAVRAVAAATEPDALLARTQDIVDEAVNVSVDWTGLTLAEGSDVARGVMRERHPELTETALDALTWVFTYSWR